MGRHNAPSTGDGYTSSRKATKSSSVVRTATGAVLWKATAAIFSSRKKESPPPTK